jgi:hypothetical protein
MEDKMDTQFFMFAGWACAAIGAGFAVHGRMVLAEEREYATKLYKAFKIGADALTAIGERKTPKAKGAELVMADIARKAINEQSKALVK